MRPPRRLPSRDLSSSAAGRRRQLLPFGVVQIGAPAALNELDHRGDDRPDERELQEFAEEPALLLGVLCVGHGLPPSGVGLDGLEPSTSSLSGMRSNRAELQARHGTAARPEPSVVTPGKRCQTGVAQRFSASVISIPPTRSLIRLYMKQTSVLMIDQMTTRPIPITKSLSKIHVESKAN